MTAEPQSAAAPGAWRQPILIDDPVDGRLDDFRDLSRADRRPDRPGGRGLVIAEGTIVVLGRRSPCPATEVPRRAALARGHARLQNRATWNASASATISST